MRGIRIVFAIAALAGVAIWFGKGLFAEHLTPAPPKSGAFSIKTLYVTLPSSSWQVKAQGKNGLQARDTTQCRQRWQAHWCPWLRVVAGEGIEQRPLSGFLDGFPCRSISPHLVRQTSIDGAPTGYYEYSCSTSEGVHTGHVWYIPSKKLLIEDGTGDQDIRLALAEKANWKWWRPR